MPRKYRKNSAKISSCTKKYALAPIMLCNIKNPRKDKTPNDILDFNCKYNFPIILIMVPIKIMFTIAVEDNTPVISSISNKNSFSKFNYIVPTLFQFHQTNLCLILEIAKENMYWRISFLALKLNCFFPKFACDAELFCNLGLIL